jgi:hypothetical protein
MAGSVPPATRCIAITPSDTVPLSIPIKGIYVGGAGDLAVTAQSDGSPVTFKAVPVGTIIPVRAKLVMATNTTATLLIGMM